MNRSPNILLIHADQHRYDCLGAYGNKEIKTPHLDELANDSTVYENSFCSYPVCTPSRYSLLSGQYVYQHCGRSNRCTLKPDLPSLPRILKDNSYRTTAVGKMHFTPTYLDIGFQDMRLAEQDGGGRYEDDYHAWLLSEGIIDRMDMIDQIHTFRKDAPAEYWNNFGALPSDLDEKHHSTTWIAEQSIDCISEWKEGGNFLMTGFIKPHHPFDPPYPWADMYKPEDLSILAGWTDDLIHNDSGNGYFKNSTLSEEKLKRIMALYYASISQIDHQVGRMIKLLKDKGIYDNTIIIYTSDHGDYLGYHHRILKSDRLFDPLAKVPLIVKFPQNKNQAKRDARLVNNIDILPTLLSLCNIELPENLSGKNLNDDNEQHEYIFSETEDGSMLRSKTKKLLLHKDQSQSMFFDLENDPFELTNLIDDPKQENDIRVFMKELAKYPNINDREVNYLNLESPVLKSPIPKNCKIIFEETMKKYTGLPITAKNNIIK